MKENKMQENFNQQDGNGIIADVMPALRKFGFKTFGGLFVLLINNTKNDSNSKKCRTSQQKFLGIFHSLGMILGRFINNGADFRNNPSDYKHSTSNRHQTADNWNYLFHNKKFRLQIYEEK